LGSQPNLAPNKIKAIKENTQTAAPSSVDIEQEERARVGVGSRAYVGRASRTRAATPRPFTAAARPTTA
jgi:hypothetical protein